MRGAGRGIVLSVAAVVALTIPSGAEATMAVRVNDDAITVTGSRGAAPESLKVDVEASGGLVFHGALASPLPAGCVASADLTRLVCPPPAERLVLNVTTYGGDDRIELGSAGSKGDRAFGKQFLLATVRSGAGRDLVESAAENTFVRLGPGRDAARLSGEGIDRVNGGVGDDRMIVTKGDASLTGGPGADSLRAGPTNGNEQGGPGPDLIYGGAGDDEITGNSGDDRIYGRGGADWIGGGTGNDLLRGGSGSDLMLRGSGEDSIAGGPGRDGISGGPGTQDRCSIDPGSGFMASVECELSF